MKAGLTQIAVPRSGLVRLSKIFEAESSRGVGGNPLRLSAPRVGIFRTMVLICNLALPSIATAQNGPFSAYAGSWTGNGVVTASNGNSERIRCRAHYSVLQSDTDLNQHLRCASDSYHFDVNSVLSPIPRGASEEPGRRRLAARAGV
jgi:hypothetical protein